MEEAALSSRLNTQEKLLISQAVYKLGAVNWEKISALLENHPVIEGRPKEWFDATTVEGYYVRLMTEIGQNVPAQDGARERAKVHLRLAQTFYLARLHELKTSIEEYEQNFSKLMTEITAIKSGSMDKVLKDEIRGVLVKKFGKKLLDSWVPEEEAVKEALESGPPTEEELKLVAEPVVMEAESSKESKEDEGVKEPEVAVIEEEAQAKAEEEEPVEDVTMEEPEQTPTKATTALPDPEAQASSPTNKVDESATSPASDLSSVPGSPVRSAKAARGNSKRKASTQPRGAPQSKRSTRRRTTATPAAEEEAPIEAEPELEPEADKEEEAEEAAESVELVPETPTPAEEDLPRRGRRATQRESVARRPSTRKATSPETSTRHSSPITAKRAQSASSARSQSATPVAEGRPRRGRKGRGMRDGVVSKSVREQSAAESGREEDDTPKAIESEMEAESVAEIPEAEEEADEDQEKEAKVEAEEEEEPARPPTRASRRTKSNAAPATPVALDTEAVEEDAEDQEEEAEEEQEEAEEEEEEEEKLPTRSSRRGKEVETPVPDKVKEADKKNTRRSSARGVIPVEEEEKPEIKEEPKGKTAKRPRQSSPRENKATKAMLNNLLDQISGHKNGGVFQHPVKPNDAPGYEDIIKRPMSIKAVRTRIREGQITTIDEFERDVMLIFANATMYNSKGSRVYEMAVEMMKESEILIKHLKNVQVQHLNRG